MSAMYDDRIQEEVQRLLKDAEEQARCSTTGERERAKLLTGVAQVYVNLMSARSKS